MTNDDIAPKLTVTKLVINDNGGTAVSSDFTMLVNGVDVSLASFPGDAAGVTVTMDAGAFSVSESGPFGYQPNMGADCAGTINVGEVKSCIITNDDIAPKLIVTKIVNNNDGRTAVPGDFTMNVLNNNVSVANVTGSSVGVEVVMNVGTYSVKEGPAIGYQASYGVGCSGTLSLGQVASCVVTNNDIPKGLATNSELCQYDFSAIAGNQFLLNFRKDKGNSYTLNSSNPGQFYYNVVPDHTGTVTVTIPYPFVTAGATPIHVYTGFTWDEATRCYTPGSTIYTSTQQKTLASYTLQQVGQTTVLTVPNVPAGTYLNIHLDYGFKGTSNWSKAGTTANSGNLPGVSITSPMNYTFSDDGTVGGSSSTVGSINQF